MRLPNQLLTAFFVKHGALFKDKASTSMASPVQVFKKDGFLNNFILSSNLSMEELAFLCNTSLFTFKRRFFRIYNTSPNKWILEKRMELAAKMLSGSESKVSDIYLVLGYENLSSFIQSFKQVYGITPKQFQMQNLRAIIAL